jgi:multisubunit Na+/H+ antiporter MnhC subunit
VVVSVPESVVVSVFVVLERALLELFAVFSLCGEAVYVYLFAASISPSITNHQDTVTNL